MAELTGPETEAPSAAPPSGPGPDAPRDASHWAAKVDRLQVQAREGVRGTNVAGKRLTGPAFCFSGQTCYETWRWRKTRPDKLRGRYCARIATVRVIQ